MSFLIVVRAAAFIDLMVPPNEKHHHGTHLSVTCNRERGHRHRRQWHSDGGARQECQTNEVMTNIMTRFCRARFAAPAQGP